MGRKDAESNAAVDLQADVALTKLAEAEGARLLLARSLLLLLLLLRQLLDLCLAAAGGLHRSLDRCHGSVYLLLFLSQQLPLLLCLTVQRIDSCLCLCELG